MGFYSRTTPEGFTNAGYLLPCDDAIIQLVRGTNRQQTRIVETSLQRPCSHPNRERPQAPFAPARHGDGSVEQSTAESSGSREAYADLLYWFLDVERCRLIRPRIRGPHLSGIGTVSVTITAYDFAVQLDPNVCVAAHRLPIRC